MSKKDPVIKQVREAFSETEHPGDEFLIGSHEGCEPAEVISPFMKVSNSADVSIETLDENSEALSFFSEGGFRFFLPAYLVADLKDSLQEADPVFHLTHGFSDTRVPWPVGGQLVERPMGKSELLNPRRYGAMSVCDNSRYRLSIFTQEEASAIVAYLEYRRDSDSDGFDVPSISVALESFWHERALIAPTSAMLRKHLVDEAAYLS